MLLVTPVTSYKEDTFKNLCSSETLEEEHTVSTRREEVHCFCVCVLFEQGNFNGYISRGLRWLNCVLFFAFMSEYTMNWTRDQLLSLVSVAHEGDCVKNKEIGRMEAGNKVTSSLY